MSDMPDELVSETFRAIDDTPLGQVYGHFTKKKNVKFYKWMMKTHEDTSKKDMFKIS